MRGIPIKDSEIRELLLPAFYLASPKVTIPENSQHQHRYSGPNHDYRTMHGKSKSCAPT
eukprot:m.355039 g.355039  ORF g.355039 m.355039 type:complete len:59 (-) comp76572_c0_seq1:59-235(-)